MNGMKTTWAVGIVLLLVASTAVAGAEFKVGIIDAQKVLENTKAGKKATAGLEAYVKERQEVINRDEESITKLKEQLEKQAAVLSPKAREEKQAELERRLGEYQKKVGEMSREVQKQKGQVLREFNDQLEKIVSRIAAQDGIALILDSNSEGGPVVYADKSLDLTDKVIKEYDKIAP